jgi:HEAT repeat protein
MPGEPKPASPDAGAEALIARAQAGDARALGHLLGLGPVAVPGLMQGLWSDSYTTRRESAKLLGEIGGDARAAAPSLARVLKDDGNTETRAEAARALGLTGAYSAIPALTKALKDEEAIVRLTAAQSLVALGAEAEAVLPTLTKSLKSPRPAEQQAAARLLGNLGPEAAPAVLALQESLVDADPLVTYRIAEALGRIGPGAKGAVPLLKSKATDHQEAALFRVPSAVALWRISRDPAAAELLRAALAEKKTMHPPPHNALLRIDPSGKTIEQLAKKLESENSDEVLRAAGALGTRTKAAIPALLKLLKAEDATSKYEVAEALARFGPDAKESLEKLRTMAKQKDLAAAVALYQIEPKPENALAIAEFFEDKDKRLAAAVALKHLRPRG